MKFKRYFKALSLIFLFTSCQENSTQINCDSVTTSNSIVSDPITSSSIIGPLDWIKFNQTGDYPQNSNENAVAQIKIPAIIASCTGFLINENTIMTNNHCIDSASKAKNVTAIFRNEFEERTSFVCDEFITTNFQYDFSLVKCKGSPGKKFGWVGLSKEIAQMYSKLYLVQENCNYIANPRCIIDKFVSFGENLGSQTTRIYHNADTLAGSSGSPIFSDDTHQVIAIHNTGSLTRSGSSAKNGGIPMYQIRNIIEKTTNVIIHEFGTAGEYPVGEPPVGESPVGDSPGEDTNINDNCKT